MHKVTTKYVAMFAKRMTGVLMLATTMMLSAPANAWVTTASTPSSACNTAMQASQTLVTGWQMNNRRVAGLCAYPLVVNTLFMKRPASQSNAGWRPNGCTWIGVNRASCLYTFEGGAANLTLMAFSASQWRVISVAFMAD